MGSPTKAGFGLLQARFEPHRAASAPGAECVWSDADDGGCSLTATTPVPTVIDDYRSGHPFTWPTVST